MEIKRIPLPLAIKRQVLAFGAQNKNTLCFAKGKYAYLSGIHSDLTNPDDFMLFKKDAKYFLKKNPKVIAYDLHPEYQSTKFALSLPAKSHKLRAIQHHHAHIASCMADNGLSNQKIIGVAFDGTGLGRDDTLWGGEFLICDYKNFRRAAHLRAIPLLGGAKAIVEPWRLAAAWLYSVYKDGFWRFKIDFIKGIDKNKWKILKNASLAGVDFPLASSMGRLFDAAASLILAKKKAGFEAELAIELEEFATSYELSLGFARDKPATSYELNITKTKDQYIIDPALTFIGIIKDLNRREPKERIAYKFHLTVAEMIKKMCLILRGETKINKVALSGGVFQNSLLLKSSLDLLYKYNFQVFTHKKLPCNDACISLGQAIIAAQGKLICALPSL